MNTTEEQSRYLQQIPVFALGQLVSDHFPSKEGEPIPAVRLQSALNRKPRRLRQELTALINACPEIADDEIKALCWQKMYIRSSTRRSG